MSAPSLTNASAVRRLRPAERQVLLWIGDLSMQVLSLLLAIYVWSFFWAEQGVTGQVYLSKIPWWFYSQALLFLVLISGLHEPHRAGRRSDGRCHL